MKKTFLFLLFTLSIFSASARVFSVRATLNITEGGSPASGTLTGTLDDVTGVFNYTLSVINTGPSAPMNGHSFRLGANSSDPILFLIFSANNPYNGTVTFSIPNISDVKAGNVYITAILGETGESVSGQITIGMEIFNNAARNDFYGIGGYSFTEGYIPDGSQSSPYVRSGPSPQNDFMYVATTPNGTDLYGSLGRLSTFVFNTAITLTFKGNNVRKLGLKVYEEDFSGALTNGSINATITTNLNNTSTLTSTDGARFVGFRVLNQDEYIVSATFSANAGLFTSLDEIMFGDDTPQNVALNFDGVDDFVQIPNTVGNFATNDNFTVSCWVKPNPTQTDLSSTFNRIIDKLSGFSGFPFTIRYYNQSAGADAGKVYIARYGGGFNISSLTSSVAINDGNWHHVAMVRSSSPATITVYIDGVASGSVADITSGTTTNTTPLFIGHGDGNFNRFKGEIDEVRIWNIAKTPTQIAEERFCKTLTNTTNLQASYNFSNGVPHDDNPLITQIQDAVSTNHGTLNNFARTGDASNFVTGQVKYVNNDAIGSNNGSSWTNAFTDLQPALTANTCNDLFEVYVAKSNTSYKPAAPNGNVNTSFVIPTGIRIYGGFAGTEKSINQRNMDLIHSTNKTTLSGDLNGNDTPFVFNSNRGDNSNYPVNITGNNVVFDGFTVSGSSAGAGGAGIGMGIGTSGTNAIIKNSRMIDNANRGLHIFGGNATIANCSMMGNKSSGIYLDNSTTSIKECLIANNGFSGISILLLTGTLRQTTITNSTIASNANYGIDVLLFAGTSINILKNTLIYDNASGGILNDNFLGTIINTITYSLVQGDAGGTNGNLNGNTVNPQFVSPLANTVRSDAGDYRLKWCSRAIGAGDNAGISPLDLDLKPRNFGGTADMGAYEFLGNTPSQVATSNIIGTIDSPTYVGGAIQTITSTAKILAPAGAIDFKAPNSITLNPGFEARGVGKYFKAEIGANVGCVNP
jgi:hypothetical protein